MLLQRKRYFRVGLLVVSTCVLFCALLLFIVGSSLGSLKVSYLIRFEENVKGMVIGSRVNYQGVPVGQVSDMRFKNGFTEVTLEVDARKAEIADVTRARLDRLLVTGQVTVELEGWSEGARTLPPGSEIPAKADPLRHATQTLPDLAVEVSVTMASMTRFLDRATGVLETLPPRLTATLDRVDDLVGDARRAARTLDATLQTYDTLAAESDFAGTLTAARDALHGVAALEQRAGRVLAELRGLLGSSRAPLLAALRGFRDTLAEAKALARMLKLAPDSVLYGREAPELAVPAAAPRGGK